MDLSNLEKLPSRKKNRRVGRGHGSGWVKTCGRGSNGQKSRSGDSISPWFSGGNIPFTRRLPKLGGFRNVNRVEYAAVNLEALNAFDEGAEVTLEALREKGLVRKNAKLVKILGGGELTRKVIVKAHKISRSAQEALEKTGGEFIQI